MVITDRPILDKQIGDAIKCFAQVGSNVGHATHSGVLKDFIADGKKIIISTVQKFPFIVDEISHHHRGRPFAIIIDKAHSSQGGRTASITGWKQKRCFPMPATLRSPRPPRQRPWNYSVSLTRTGA